MYIKQKNANAIIVIDELGEPLSGTQDELMAHEAMIYTPELFEIVSELPEKFVKLNYVPPIN